MILKSKTSGPTFAEEFPTFAFAVRSTSSIGRAKSETDTKSKASEESKGKGVKREREEEAGGDEANKRVLQEQRAENEQLRFAFCIHSNRFLIHFHPGLWRSRGSTR